MNFQKAGDTCTLMGCKSTKNIVAFCGGGGEMGMLPKTQNLETINKKINKFDLIKI